MMTTKAVIVTGAGGVGKTTIAASLAVQAASEGKETLVLTVDPARRLASALGVELGGRPTRHPHLSRLWGAMMDGAASWVTVARRHADPAVADRLVRNEFFEAATAHFPASQSYAAAEEAATYIDSLRWDLVVVDTPPSAGGIEFFTAPGRMADLVGGRLLRLLTGGRIPGRTALFNRGARPLLRFADQVLGADLLERVALFLMDLRTTYDGVSKQSKLIEGHFRRAAILVVTTADPAPLLEAERFFGELRDHASTPAAVVFNRSLPVHWAKAEVAPRTPAALTENLHRWGAESLRQRDARTGFAARFDVPVATIPWLPEPPTDLGGLQRLIETSESIPSLW